MEKNITDQILPTTITTTPRNSHPIAMPPPQKDKSLPGVQIKGEPSILASTSKMPTKQLHKHPVNQHSLVTNAGTESPLN